LIRSKLPNPPGKHGHSRSFAGCHLPLFAGFSADELGEFLREARSARFAKNSPVFEQGGEARSFFVLLHSSHSFGSDGTQRAQKGIAIEAVFPASVVHGVKARDRATHASHPEFKKHADCLRHAAHHIVHQIVEFNSHALLRCDANGNAVRRGHFVPAQRSARFIGGLLDCAAMKAVRPVQVRIEAAATLRTRKRD